MTQKILWEAGEPEASLPKGECHLHRLKFTIDDPRLEACWSILDATEKARAERAQTSLRRTRRILARGVLRQLLGRYLDQAPKSIRLRYNEHGKPLLDTPFSFNLSHSHDCIVYAFTGGDMPLGVDVEYVLRGHNLLRIAQRYFSAEEYNRFINMPTHQQTECFYFIWTQKEAFVKAQGLGLSYGLPTFTVSVDPQRPAGLVQVMPDQHEGEIARLAKKPWVMMSFSPFKTVMGALVTMGEEMDVRGFDCT